MDYQHIEHGDAQVAVAGREVHHPRARAVSPASAEQAEARQHQQLAASSAPSTIGDHHHHSARPPPYLLPARVANSFSNTKCFWNENETLSKAFCAPNENCLFLFSRSFSSSICGTAIWECRTTTRRLVSNARDRWTRSKDGTPPHSLSAAQDTWLFVTFVLLVLIMGEMWLGRQIG